MLTELRLNSLGVVADAVLPLGPGLTALTGETGAGKTMIVAGLGLLLGARADASLVRNGQDRALVQGRWEVGENTAEAVEALGGDLDDGVELVTLRQISSQGRSRATVGGVQVPVSTVAGLLTDLATIHGQSEQTRLSTPERQRELLDAFVALVEHNATRRDLVAIYTATTMSALDAGHPAHRWFAAHPEHMDDSARITGVLLTRMLKAADR